MAIPITALLLALATTVTARSEAPRSAATADTDRAVAPAEQVLAGRFAAALATDTPWSLTPLTVKGLVDDTGWVAARDTLERFRDVTIEGIRTSVGQRGDEPAPNLELAAPSSSATCSR